MDIDPIEFWSRVEMTKDCWLWRGTVRKKDRYGLYYKGNKTLLAHRVSYKLTKGEIPEGLQLDHLCRVRSCVNPGHLEAVTQRENILRGIGIAAVSAKKTHCQYGHEFAGRNLKINKKGERVCRKCKARWQIEYMARKRAR